MPLVCLFIRSEEFDHAESETIAHLFPFDKHTVHSGATLTVTGTATCNEASHLIIEDGGQLIHSTYGVQAVMKKSIEAYSSNDGWYLMASPVAENNLPEIMLNGNYDLYRFDQSEDLEWRNYKKQSFTMASTDGYLYANSTNVVIPFIGTLRPSNAEVEKNLVLDADAVFAGFNLIGNPFPCTAYLDGNVPFYRMSANRTALTAATGAIAPMEGVFVQASNDLSTVSFTTTVQRDNGLLNLSVSGNAGVKSHFSEADNVLIAFGEGHMLGKFMLNPESTKLYVPQDNREMAVVRSEGQGEMPVSFKAAENGTYTLRVDAENVDMNYLHLIDNLTGADVDLLVTPCYSFEARTTDYASRFKLLFSVNQDADGDDEVFAYCADGEIRLIETHPDAFLQVIDMMGRVIVSRDGAHTVSTNGIPAGLYILRLINGDEVKTQKIVVK
jgi:hypothetical protein